MTVDKCICCGETIPEGRQVCPACEALAREQTQASREEIWKMQAKLLADQVQSPNLISDREATMDTNLAISPCRDCADRKPRCHSTCTAYLNWAVAKRRANMETRNPNTIGFEQRIVKKMRRGMHQRECPNAGKKI